MRGDVIYEIWGMHEGREQDCYFGAYRTREAAQAGIEKLKKWREPEWPELHHNRGFAIRERIVEVDFEIPSLPKPRDKYFVRHEPKPNQPGTWDSTRVGVYRRGDERALCEYVRHYSMLQTFEPFRQADRDFALVSMDYTRTAVLDLTSGTVIAEEPPSQWGFCPVGFYVPDWWDVNDDSIIPGSEQWRADHEWPTGDFGFVWGCIWGDDSSWKVQYLDLSRVRDGLIRREERFGYVELATRGYTSPCLTAGPVPAERSKPPAFIQLWRDDGDTRVTFEVEMAFSLETGQAEDWERRRVNNLE